MNVFKLKLLFSSLLFSAISTPSYSYGMILSHLSCWMVQFNTNEHGDVLEVILLGRSVGRSDEYHIFQSLFDKPHPVVALEVAAAANKQELSSGF